MNSQVPLPPVIKPIADMSKQEVASEIGQLEADLTVYESNLRQAEVKASQVSRGGGCAIILLGLILSFVIPIVGIPLLIIGLVVQISNDRKPKAGAVSSEIAQLQQVIAAKHGRLAELKAQSIIGDQAPAPSQASAEERLAKLADLRTKGLIDEAEYTAKRQQILKEI